MYFDEKKLVSEKELLAGIHNYGNTCHLNSVIQFLHSIVPYRNEIIKLHPRSSAIMTLIKMIFIDLNKRST